MHALRILFRFVRARESTKSSTRLRFVAGYAGIARRDRWHLLTFQGVYQFHSKTLRNLSATRVDMLIKSTRICAHSCRTWLTNVRHTIAFTPAAAGFPGAVNSHGIFSDRLHATACRDYYILLYIAINYLLTSEMFHWPLSMRIVLISPAQ